MFVTLNSASSTTDVIVKSGISSDLNRTGSEIDNFSNFIFPWISSSHSIGSSSNFSLQCGFFPELINDENSDLEIFSASLS